MVSNTRIVSETTLAWAMRDSNPRHPACKADWFPMIFWMQLAVKHGLTKRQAADTVFQRFAGFPLFYAVF